MLGAWSLGVAGKNQLKNANEDIFPVVWVLFNML